MSIPERSLPTRAFRLRVRVVAGVFCAVCFAGLAARLAWLQLVSEAWYADRALGQQLRDTAVPAPRGSIYSADGVLLAASASCWTIRASPREIPEEKLSLAAEGLAGLLGLDAGEVLEKFSDRRSNDCLLRRRVSREEAEAVRAFCARNQLSGVRINPDTRRWYPEGEFLASVLGFTNVDNEGVSGLELEYNDVLSGQDGRVLTAVNAWGYPLEQSYAVQQAPVQGGSLVLTIDTHIQRALENALGYAVQEHSAAARGVGIVLDVNTGAVLAMATTPAYDPNSPRLIYDEAARSAVNTLDGEARAAALQLAQQTQWRNKAVSDLYEPGSVFKLITCAAALDAGAVAPEDTFVCSEHIAVAGVRFHCANRKRHGVQTVTEALMNSCNQSFIQIGARLGKEAFCDYFAAFGLREATGIDLPAEPAKSLYYTADRMGPVELASCSFGQSSKEAVVTDGGGRRAQIAGYRVGGKSGTSQKLDSDDPTARIASFVAAAPMDDPQLLCLVCIDEPHSWTTAGGTISAPVCAEVLEQALVYRGVPRAAQPEADAAPAAAELPPDGDTPSGE